MAMSVTGAKKTGRSRWRWLISSGLGWSIIGAGCGNHQPGKRTLGLTQVSDLASDGTGVDLALGGGTLIYPSSLRVVRGSVSGQLISVLSSKVETGTADDWGTYLEFTPASTGLAVILTFTLPPTITSANLTSLVLSSNFKGQAKATQQWLYKIYDNAAASWVVIGDNTAASSWKWNASEFTASGVLSRYVNPLGKISIRYETLTAFDASDLDYLALSVGAGSSPSPSPSPSPAPAVSPAPTAPPAPTANPTPTPPVSGTWWKPSPGTSWQMQYSGTIDTSLNVQAYMLDMFGTSATTISTLHARGVKVVCYIDGGSWESYTPDAATFPASIIGKGIGGWPDEKWLDIRSKTLLWPIMRARLDLAKQKGCDGIYHDWADSYAGDTGFPLTAQDQLTYNKDFWVAEAHARGLSIGLINDLVQINDLVALYDFAMNESCSAYNECGLVKPFIDAKKAVFSLNYTGNTATVCAALNALNFDAIFKDVNLGSYRLPCR